jgi:hypothetical protein
MGEKGIVYNFGGEGAFKIRLYILEREDETIWTLSKLFYENVNNIETAEERF